MWPSSSASRYRVISHPPPNPGWLDRARDQGLPIEPLARVSLVQRAEIPRPLLDLNDGERESGSGGDSHGEVGKLRASGLARGFLRD